MAFPICVDSVGSRVSGSSRLKNADMSSRVDFAYIMSFIGSLLSSLAPSTTLVVGSTAGTESEGFLQVAPREVEDLPEESPARSHRRRHKNR